MLTILLPGVVDEVLRDAPLGHLVLDVAERRLVLAEVVRHVPVRVHRQLHLYACGGEFASFKFLV